MRHTLEDYMEFQVVRQVFSPSEFEGKILVIAGQTSELKFRIIRVEILVWKGERRVEMDSVRFVLESGSYVDDHLVSAISWTATNVGGRVGLIYDDKSHNIENPLVYIEL